MESKIRKSVGFTLIELLIVVAIIAILAAIAVPNFLEAQTRAKVSRVKSDMRTMATAIEAYTVDNNRGPIGADEAIRVGGLGANQQTKRQVSQSFLTTPIAYLTTLLTDPFAITGRFDSAGNTFTYSLYEYQYNDQKGTGYTESWGKGFTWWNWSSGPSKQPASHWPPQQTAYPGAGGVQPYYVYDSTNGTISYGYITRTNKGEYTGDNG